MAQTLSLLTAVLMNRCSCKADMNRTCTHAAPETYMYIVVGEVGRSYRTRREVQYHVSAPRLDSTLISSTIALLMLGYKRKFILYAASSYTAFRENSVRFLYVKILRSPCSIRYASLLPLGTSLNAIPALESISRVHCFMPAR